MDDDFAREMIRAAALAAGSQQDAGRSVMARAIGHVEGISDDLARELFGFFSGLAQGLFVCGQPEGVQLLAAVSVPAPTPADMRRAIAAALNSLTGAEAAHLGVSH